VNFLSLESISQYDTSVVLTFFVEIIARVQV